MMWTIVIPTRASEPVRKPPTAYIEQDDGLLLDPIIHQPAGQQYYRDEETSENTPKTPSNTLTYYKGRGIPRKQRNIIFKPGNIVRFLPERCQIMVIKSRNIMLKPPQKAFREEPKLDRINHQDNRVQIGMYDDAVPKRVTSRAARLVRNSPKQPLANQPLYATVNETGNPWEIRDYYGNEPDLPYVNF